MPKPKRLTPWMLACNPRAFEPIVWEPSDWERLLQQLGIKDDEQAMKVLMAKGERSKQLRLWLGEFAHRKFVPVKVLEQVGLKRAVEGRFEHSWN